MTRQGGPGPIAEGHGHRRPSEAALGPVSVPHDGTSRPRERRSGNTRPPTVVVIQQSLRRYRSTFYEEFRSRLDGAGVRLRLIESQLPNLGHERGDHLTLPWAEQVPARLIRIAGRDVVWQPVLDAARGADLVVMEQGARHLVNYLLLLRQQLGGTKVAYWGHGRAFDESKADPLGEKLKAFTSRRVSWWFAYNHLAADVVTDLGFPRERITDVRNSTDSRQLEEDIRRVTERERRELLERLGLQGGKIGVFVGGMVPPKRLDYLLDAAERIRERVPGFEVVLTGDGPDAARVRERASRHDWMATTGPQFDADLARLLSIGHVLLMPGSVGLVIIDAFAAGLPLVASSSAAPGPELAYMTPGVDGLIVDDAGDPELYARAVADLLEDEDRRRALADGAKRAAASFGSEEMARRFADGVLRALAS
jgi:glycosyltransferase involved in cell wall biosynthesis